MQLALYLFMLFKLFFKQTCVKSVHDRAPEDMQFMALKCKFCINHRNIVSVLCLIINLGAHVRWLQYLVCLCLCFLYSGTSHNQAYKQQYQRLQRDTGMKYKMGFFFKTLCSEVMASFAYRDSPRRHSSALELAFSTTKYSKVV